MSMFNYEEPDKAFALQVTKVKGFSLITYGY